MKLVRLDDDFQDWPGLLSLVLEAFAFMNARINPPSSALRLTPEALREKAASEIGLIVVENQKLLGCMFCRPEPDCLYIGKLAIASDSQGRGIGRTLLNAATGIAREHGLPALRLETRIELLENHAIFGRWGFEKTGEHAHSGFDRPTYIEMRKAL